MNYLLFFILTASLITADYISGNVFDIDTNNPLSNVNIFISGSGVGTITDENGTFKLDNIESGEYVISASMIGYKAYSQNIFTNKISKKHIQIFLDKEPLQWQAINVMGFIPSKHSPEITQMVVTDRKLNTNQNTLSTLLNNLHGIQVQSAHDYGRNVNISIRGSSDFKPGGYNNRVLLLLDGFPVSIPNSGSSDWNAIPFETVQRIEVVRGPASSVYGHNSMGGVINIVTRSGAGMKKWHPELRFGSYDSKALSLSYSKNIQKMNINSSLGHISSKGHRFNSGFKQSRLSFKINRELPKGQKIQLSVIACNSFNQQPGFIYPDNPDLISYRESFRLSGYAQLYYKRLIGNNIFSLSLATNQFKTDYRDRDDTPLDHSQGKTNYRDNSFIVRSQFQRFFNGDANLTFGTELSLDQSKSNVLRNIFTQPEQNTIAGFIQYRKPLSKEFLYDIGLRYDLREVTGGEGYSVKTFKAVSPKFTLFYKVNSNLTTHLSINQGFRAPSISELFLEYQSSYGLLLQGNPTIKAESLISTDLGIKYEYLESLSFFSNIFFNRYKDMIDFIYTIPVQSINREEVNGVGFEFGSNILIEKTGSNINFSYSYLEMNNMNSNIPLFYRPKQRLRFTMVQESPIATFQFSSRYTSSQLYEDFLSDDHPIENNTVIFPLETLPKTIITDLSVSVTIMNYDFSLKIKNLFNENYALIQHYPMPRRNFEFTINKTID